MSSTRRVHLLQLGNHHLHIIITKASFMLRADVVCVSIHLKEYRCVSQNVWREVRGQPQMLSSLSILFERGSLCYLPAEYTEPADPILPTGALRLQVLLAQVYVGSRDSDMHSECFYPSRLLPVLGVFHL